MSYRINLKKKNFFSTKASNTNITTPISSQQKITKNRKKKQTQITSNLRHGEFIEAFMRLHWNDKEVLSGYGSAFVSITVPVLL